MKMKTLTLGLSILFAGACNKAADEGDTGAALEFDDLEESEDDDGGDDGGSNDGGSDDGGSDDGGDDDGDDGGDDDGGNDDDTGDDGGDDDGGDDDGETSGSGTTGGDTDGETSGGDTDGETSGGETGGSTTGPGEEATDDEREPLEDVSEGDEATDDDGDGVTEEDGDCDDTDATVYPGADEACDGIDTSCDGYRDLEFWDDFEPNDDFDTAQDLGDIDSWILGSTTDLLVEDLNFDYAGDEDWFVWNANDTWYDDPKIKLKLTAAPGSAMNFDVTLYALRTSDAGEYSALETLVTRSEDGVTEIVITEEDFPREESSGAWWEGIWDTVTGWFDGSDDFFYVKISTDSTWTPADCESNLYDLTIES